MIYQTINFPLQSTLMLLTRMITMVMTLMMMMMVCQRIKSILARFWAVLYHWFLITSIALITYHIMKICTYVPLSITLLLIPMIMIMMTMETIVEPAWLWKIHSQKWHVYIYAEAGKICEISIFTRKMDHQRTKRTWMDVSHEHFMDSILVQILVGLPSNFCYI